MDHESVAAVADDVVVVVVVVGVVAAVEAVAAEVAAEVVAGAVVAGVVGVGDGKDAVENCPNGRGKRGMNPVDVPGACTAGLQVGVAQDNQWRAGQVAPECQSAHGADSWMADRHHDQSLAPSDGAGAARHSNGNQARAHAPDQDVGGVDTGKDTID